MHVYETGGIITVSIEEGLNFYELAEAIRTLAALQPFYCREIILQVLTDDCTLTYRQMQSIIIQAKEQLNAASAPIKIALVVNTDLQSGMARLFMEGVNDAACTFAVFREPETALQWVCRQLKGRTLLTEACRPSNPGPG